MAKINSRDKGKRYELHLSKILRERGYEARRGQQFSGGGDSPDVVHNIPRIHIEAKHVENLNIHKAMEQATRDAEGTGNFPTVWMKKNRKEELVVMKQQDFLDLLDLLFDI